MLATSPPKVHFSTDSATLNRDKGLGAVEKKKKKKLHRVGHQTTFHRGHLARFYMTKIEMLEIRGQWRRDMRS